MEDLVKNITKLLSVIVIIFMVAMGFLGDIIAEWLQIPATPTIIASSVLGIPLGILGLIIFTKLKKK